MLWQMIGRVENLCRGPIATIQNVTTLMDLVGGWGLVVVF